MKSSDDMMNSLMQRRDEYVSNRDQKRRKFMKTALPALSLCLVLLAGVLIWHGQSADARKESEKSMEGGPSPIAQPPKSNEITFTGEKLTDEEAGKYFTENYSSLVSSLKAMGVQADGLKIAEKGYAHINYDENGAALEVHQNFRDYLAWSGDKLVAIITLTKEGGKLFSTPAFGGPWLDSYNEFLKAHSGQKLIYLYYGISEVILLPDGSTVNPLGYDVSKDFDWVKNPYEWFYNEDVVFVP